MLKLHNGAHGAIALLETSEDVRVLSGPLRDDLPDDLLSLPFT